MSERFMERDSRIFVAGIKGWSGLRSCVVWRLRDIQICLLRSRQELDLLDTVAVASFFAEEKPEFVFLAAAKVGGILANNSLPG